MLKLNRLLNLKITPKKLNMIQTNSYWMLIIKHDPNKFILDVNNAPPDLSVKTIVLNCHSGCMFRECDMCGVKKLNSKFLEQNSDIWHMWKKNVIYFKWCSPKENTNGKEIKRPFNKYRFEVKLKVLVNSYYQTCHLMSKHPFHFNWRSIQYERYRSTIIIGEVGLVMDFGQNINHR